MNIANILTTIRILLIVPVVVCYLTPFPYHQLLSAGLFAFAAFLDWADGYVARTMREESTLGATLDHTADKMLIASVLLAVTYQLHSLVITICSILIISREILVLGMREYMSKIGRKKLTKVNSLGKMKTVIQMVTVLFLLTPKPFDLPSLIGEGLMIVVVIFTLASGWKYLVQWKQKHSVINSKE